MIVLNENHNLELHPYKEMTAGPKGLLGKLLN